MKALRFRQYKKILFLWDVLKLALTAFGGPQIHFTLFKKHLVSKKNYITDQDLIEMNSFCSMLPGPTSTQTITAIGFKLGGPLFAFITLAIWILPASLFMGTAAIVLSQMPLDSPKIAFFKYLQPMASGFMIYAAYKFIQMFVTKRYHWALLVITAGVGILESSPFLIPIMLLIGGLTTSYMNTRGVVEKPKKIENIHWDKLAWFLGIFALAAIIGVSTQSRLVLLFENNFRYGSIVFGGGNALIPLMFNQFVNYKHYMTGSEFLAGLGLLQAMPGPVFSIASFAGAMSMKEYGVFGQILGMVSATIGIFLPGILLIFFALPIWNQIKKFAPIYNAIEGINATSAGFVVVSAYLLFLPVQINEENMLVLLGTLFLLLSTKVPTPIIVLGCLIGGYFF
ncbi:MAG: chromate efflux transporter [Bacteroidota bacterium]|nr:chromate efflux transporter [Bacteroidota bacterium]